MVRRSSTRHLRLAAALSLTAALSLSMTGNAVADEDDTLDERLAPFSESHVPNRWLVEVAGPSQAKGGNPKAAKQAQDKVAAAAKKAGLTVKVDKSYTKAFNGMAVTVDDSRVSTLAQLPGVESVHPVLEVDAPTTIDAEPAMEYARGMTGADVANDELGFTGEGVKVGVIDSGIDYNHPDFGGSGTNDETADFGEGRVTYGYDFVGDDYDAGKDDSVPQPDAWPDDCGGHGTHVAGIIGANGGVTGVAPDIELGAYRVFGCDGSSSSDIIVDAMERAYADGMDIINMSLGASFMTWPSYPTAQAADALVAAGLTVVVSQGNEGRAGTFSGGAPSVAHNVISVGSIDNKQLMASYVTTDTGAEVFYMPATSAPAPEPGATMGLFMDQNSPLGCPTTDLAPAPEEPTALLVNRGVCSFHEKAATAQAAGYDALIVANNTSGIINMTVEGPVEITIPAVSVLQTAGPVLAESSEVTFSEDQKRFPNPTGGYQSDFSSYGLAADLTLKPDVSAPGGSIYSTYPLEEGRYATISGTSMAAPHVAGAAALLLQAKPGLDPFEVRTALTNTADPFTWGFLPEFGLPEPVHRQGGGLIDIPQAIGTTTAVEPQKISLGEGEAGPVTTTVTVRNDGDADVTYALDVVHGVATFGSPAATDFTILDATVEFSDDTITVPAGSEATFTVSIGEDSGADGVIYGGWLTLDGETEQLVVPFAGLSGDYQALVALDLAALAYLEDGGLYLAEPFHEYSMVGEDFPYVYFNLAYPVQALYFDIYHANEDGSKGRKVHSNFINYATFLDEGRFAGPATLAWDGSYQGNKGNSKLRRVDNGDYVLELRVLKALGDPSNPDHWEIWNTPALTIAYGDGADTSAGNGPGVKPDKPAKGKKN